MKLVLYFIVRKTV